MKTGVTTLMALLLLTLTVEPTLAQQLSVGARGGYSSTTVKYDGVQQVQTNWNPNFHIGALSKLELHHNFALQLELWYAEKSSGARLPEANADGDFELSYLEIPLLAQVRVPLGQDSRLAPHLFAGPSVAFELDCGVSALIDGELVNSDCDAPNLQLERKTASVDLVFGAGVDLQAGPGAVLLDAIYDLGLTNLNDDREAPNDSVKVRAWMFSIGYLVRVASW